MSISRQLGISLFFVLTALFLSIAWINADNTKDYLQRQLTSHSQDTATSLGLSIAPYMGEQADLPIVDTMLNAIFDRGYYLNIRLENSKGDILLSKSNPAGIDGVPEWFTEIFPLLPPETYSEISTGWNVAGTIYVTSNPGFAYTQLWNNIIDALSIVSAVFLFGIVITLGIVKIITTPIVMVSNQAELISQKRFGQIGNIPRTPELKNLVVSINSMSARLKKVFDQLTSQTERYKTFAYQDSLTKIGNRRAFDILIRNIFDDTENFSEKFLVFMRLTSLVHVNREFGKEAGDSYLVSGIELVQQGLSEHSLTGTLFRTGGADLAILIDDPEIEHTVKFLDSLVANFKSKCINEYKQGYASIGVSKISISDSIPTLLSRTDNALCLAENVGNAWKLVDTKIEASSNTSWQQRISNIIQHGHVKFVTQSIKNAESTTQYNEIFARFYEHDQSIKSVPMGELIPVAFRLNYISELDRLVVKSALEYISDKATPHAINLTWISVCDKEFQSWLISSFITSNIPGENLVIEIPERAIVENPSSVNQLVSILKKHRIKITIERFGAQLAALPQLRSVQPDFLKIDGRFTRNIHNENDNQLFIQSLVSIAQGLNIKSIVELVETDEEREFLTEIGVDLLQGYAIAKPIEDK